MRSRSALKSGEDLARAILSFGTVVVSVPAFLDRHPMSHKPFQQLVNKAERAGLIHVQEDPHANHQNLSLTPLGAFRLKVKLDWNSERWVASGLRFANERKATRSRAAASNSIEEHGIAVPLEDGSGSDFVDTKALEPVTVLVAAERIAWFDRSTRKGRIDANEPRPTRSRVLVNIGRTWPIVGDCCQGIDLQYGEYCAWCDRSGPDHLIDSEQATRCRSEKLRRIRDGEDDGSPLSSST